MHIKKAEAEEYPGTVDCVLTFEELSGWLAETDTVLAQEPDDDKVEKGKTRFSRPQAEFSKQCFVITTITRICRLTVCRLVSMP